MNIMDWQDYVDNPQEHTVTGYMKIIDNFLMPQFNSQRRIWISLPSNYYNSKQHFPVLYMHDGQNLFDMLTSYSGEWHIDESLHKLYDHKKSDGVIVVGIDNGCDERFNEYIPHYEGFKYLEFVTNNLKPFIDSTFRTLPSRNHTGTAGSSLGGLISLYMGLQRPDVFSKIGAFSPAMAFAEGELNNLIKKYDMKIYLDVGTNECLPYNTSQTYATFVWDTYYQLICAGFRNDELKLIVEKDAAHNEADWSRRFPEAFLWLFGK